MKLTQNLRTFTTNFRSATAAITVAAGIGLLAGCATNQTASNQTDAYKFTVFHYKQPVEVTDWVYDPAKSDSPDGAALNITSLMQKGDVDQWLASWNESEKPAITPETREALVQSWKAVKEGRIYVENRIVADANIVLEIAVITPDQKQEIVQIPLTHSEGQWKLTKLEGNSQFLNWKASSNAIVTECEPRAFSDYLTALAKSRPQAKL